jgi:small GTP-binding protein
VIVVAMSSALNLKFIIIGSAGVGKTAILKRLVDGIYQETAQSTIGVEYDTVLFIIENRKVKLQIWDTAGQERFRSIARAYYRNAVGVILVFDVTGRKSFEALPSWMSDIHSLCDPNVVVQLIGNKSDLKSHRLVTIAEAEAFASQQKLQYIETSAKYGDNVTEAFTRVAASIMNKEYQKTSSPVDRSPFLPDPNEEQNPRKCC